MANNDSTHLTHLEKENERLKQVVQELSILNEIATAISSTNSVNHIINLIVGKCITNLKVEQCIVSLLDKEKVDADFHTMVRQADQTNIGIPYRLDTQLSGWMIRNKKPLLINDFNNDNRFFLKEQSEFPIKSLVSSPLITKGELIGLIAVFNKKGESLFTKDDEKLLSIIASQSAAVIENARLLEEEKLLFGLQEEMKLARNIQLNLLPSRMPDIDGYEISAVSIPAKDVGGDYYDFMELSETKIALCLGDITGKGLPAAMLMSNLQATLRGQAKNCDTPAKCITRSNELLYHSTESDRFATLFYGILDIEKGFITFCNAGHDTPVLIKNSGEVIEIKGSGLMLGAFPEYLYKQDEIQMNKGDTVILYSDGVTEAMNAQEEEFSLDNLIPLLVENRDKSAEYIQTKIVETVKAHSGSTPQSDDITLMIIKRSI
jgi:sigma-B regulation protein RsbU (phosphoserine phosphatase)